MLRMLSSRVALSQGGCQSTYYSAVAVLHCLAVMSRSMFRMMCACQSILGSDSAVLRCMLLVADRVTISQWQPYYAYVRINVLI